MKRWFTARETASARLPRLPATPEGMARKFRQLRKTMPGNFRKREARGGGWEISLRAFTPAAQKLLANTSFDPSAVAERLAAFNPRKRGYSGWFDWFTARDLVECAPLPELPNTLPEMVGYLRRLRAAKPAYFRRETPSGPWQVHIRALPAGVCHFVERREKRADFQRLAATLPRMFHDRTAAYFEMRRRAIPAIAETADDRRTLSRLLFAEILLRYAASQSHTEDWRFHVEIEAAVAHLFARKAAAGLFGAADAPFAFVEPATLQRVIRACAWVGGGASRRTVKTTIIQYVTELPTPQRGFCFRALICAYNSKVPVPLDALLGLRRLGFITNFPLTKRGFYRTGRSHGSLWSVNLHLDLAGPSTPRTEGNIPMDLAVRDYSTMDFLASQTLTGRS